MIALELCLRHHNLPKDLARFLCVGVLKHNYPIVSADEVRSKMEHFSSIFAYLGRFWVANNPGTREIAGVGAVEVETLKDARAKLTEQTINQISNQN
jgi:hypothetical protein